MRQSELVTLDLCRAEPAIRTELVTIVTTGDRRGSSPVRDKREWVLELESALLENKIDLAVHSGKDVPVDIADGTTLIPVLSRAAANDVLVIPARGSAKLKNPPSISPLEILASGVNVGTSSLRRAAQLRRARGDLVPTELRGNVPTRIQKMLAGEAAAAVLAGAGIARLCGDSISAPYSQIEVLKLPLDSFIPAVNQGILAVQVRTDDDLLRTLIRQLSRVDTVFPFIAERALIQAIGADCRSAVGVYAEAVGDRLKLTAAVYSPDGSEMIGGEENGSAADAAGIGKELGARLLKAGAGRLLS